MTDRDADTAPCVPAPGALVRPADVPWDIALAELLNVDGNVSTLVRGPDPDGLWHRHDCPTADTLDLDIDQRELAELHTDTASCTADWRKLHLTGNDVATKPLDVAVLLHQLLDHASGQQTAQQPVAERTLGALVAGHSMLTRHTHALPDAVTDDLIARATQLWAQHHHVAAEQVWWRIAAAETTVSALAELAATHAAERPDGLTRPSDLLFALHRCCEAAAATVTDRLDLTWPDTMRLLDTHLHSHATELADRYAQSGLRHLVHVPDGRHDHHTLALVGGPRLDAVEQAIHAVPAPVAVWMQQQTLAVACGPVPDWWDHLDASTRDDVAAVAATLEPLPTRPDPAWPARFSDALDTAAQTLNVTGDSPDGGPADVAAAAQAQP